MNKIVTLLLLAVLIAACQKQLDYSNASMDSLVILKEWLSKEGGIFSGNKIVLGNRSNDVKVVGNLSWSEARLRKSGLDEILEVPFTFNQLLQKNNKIYFESRNGELPSTYDLVIKKNKEGNIEAILRIRSFSIDSVKAKKIFQNSYDLQGNHSSSYLTYSNGKHVQLHNNNIYQNKSNSNCNMESTTTRMVNCTGGMNNTTCIFYTRTTYTYHCDEPDYGQEMPPVWWLEGDSGGYGYEEIYDEYENKTVIDSLNGYPCAQEILKQIPGLNRVADSILSNVFGNNSINKIIFKTDANLPNNVNAKRGSVSYIDNVFSVTINMNPNVLAYSSREFIAATMFHESIHAFIDYQIGRLAAKKIDTTSFKQQFPIIYAFRNKGESAHEQIVDTYLTELKSLICNYNSLLPTNVMDAIAWEGLQGTTNWTKLGNDTIQFRQIQSTAKYGSTAGMDSLCLNKCN
jgi:hypothetical protein